LKFILIILDGFGLRDSKDGNAYALAKTPTLDNLLTNKPMATLEASGSHVGLPDGIMGNSEVGHTNIGAGRIVKQDFVSINESIKQNSLKAKEGYGYDGFFVSCVDVDACNYNEDAVEQDEVQCLCICEALGRCTEQVEGYNCFGELDNDSLSVKLNYPLVISLDNSYTNPFNPIV